MASVAPDQEVEPDAESVDTDWLEQIDIEALEASEADLEVKKTCIVLNGKPTGFEDSKDGQATYIGRQNAHYGLDCHPIANPHTVEESGRKESLMEFARTLIKAVGHDPDIEQQVKDLHGEVLACWCHPKLCHGDVIALYLAYRYHAGLPLEQIQDQITVRLNREIDRRIEAGDANPADYY